MIKTTHKIKSIHVEARRLAFDFYIRRGRVPLALSKIIRAASLLEVMVDLDQKYNPAQPRAPAGSPDGGQWIDTGGGNGNTDSGGEGPFRDAPDIDDPPLEPMYPEVLILPFLRAPRIIGALRAFISSRRRGAGWTFGSFKSPKRWANQMEKRNWTPDEITSVIKKGNKYPAPNKVNPRNTAVRYEDPKTGRFVVRDEVTKEILQISGDKFNPSKFP